MEEKSMTREEAIEILKGAIKKPNTKDGYLGQALDMAIKALEQEPKWDRLYSWLNDMRYGIAPDETVTDIDERNVRTAQVDLLDEIMEWIEKHPQEPKTGHWIFQKIIHGKRMWCSNCDSSFDLCCNQIKRYDEATKKEYLWSHCPWCGAKMVEPQETETWNGYHEQITAPKGTFERIFNEADDGNDI